MEPPQPADLKKLEDLTADPTNPRILSKHDGEALGRSITKFGDLSCIVFNVRTQQLVGGHQRIEIMKRLGERHQVQIIQRYAHPDEVGTVALGHVYIGNKAFAYREVDWDEGTQKAANIAANRIQGEFDNDLLAQVDYQLSQLENGAELLELTGQTNEEIMDLLSAVAGDDKKSSPDQLGKLSFNLDPAQAEVVRSALFKSRQANNLDVESGNVDAEALYLICRDYIDEEPAQTPAPDPSPAETPPPSLEPIAPVQ